jgi:hypothetical protein
MLVSTSGFENKTLVVLLLGAEVLGEVACEFPTAMPRQVCFRKSAPEFSDRVQHSRTKNKNKHAHVEKRSSMQVQIHVAALSP